jgi:glycosyltransferase involved in cell wall biosynthesis
LRVLTVGTFSLRKGAFDYVKIASTMKERCQFRFVGAVETDAAGLREQAGGSIEFRPKRPQYALPSEYEWADLFLFPTLEDGYAVVLAQAQAAGLPIFATTNCAAPDLVVQGETGWVLPIRRPDLFIERLRWYDQRREELAAMAKTVYDAYRMRDWSDVARDFVTECAIALEAANVRQDVARA